MNELLTCRSMDYYVNCWTKSCLTLVVGPWPSICVQSYVMMQLAHIVQNDFSKLQLPAKARHQGKFPIGFSLKAYLYGFILSLYTN